VKGPPELYLKTIGVRPSCAFRPERPAILDPAHRATVNHEVFFFSTSALRKLFLGDPLRWCGVVTDPVSGLRFQPEKGSPRTDYEGRAYFFSSPETLSTFKMDPAMYQDAKRKMPPPATPPPQTVAPSAPQEAAPPGRP
jgi:YHS domain-containing protein